MIKVRID